MEYLRPRPLDPGCLDSTPCSTIYYCENLGKYLLCLSLLICKWVQQLFLVLRSTVCLLSVASVSAFSP